MPATIILEPNKFSLIPHEESEAGTPRQWVYLAERPQSWKKQLFLKGTRLTAFHVWRDMLVNNMTEDKAADDVRSARDRLQRDRRAHLVAYPIILLVIKDRARRQDRP